MYSSLWILNVHKISTTVIADVVAAPEINIFSVNSAIFVHMQKKKDKVVHKYCSNITVNTHIIGMFLFGYFGVCQMVAKLNDQHKCTQYI